MNWITFAISAALALVLDRGLATLWQVWLGNIGPIEPSCVLVLAVFLAMMGPGFPMLWACVILGLLVDLTQLWPMPQSHESMAIVGPAAVGFLAGGYLVLQVRTFVYRCSPVSLAMMVFLAGLLMHLVVTALLTLRGLPFLGGGIPNFSPADQLLERFFSLIYSAALAMPLGWVLLRTRSWWRFQSGPGAGSGRRIG